MSMPPGLRRACRAGFPLALATGLALAVIDPGGTPLAEVNDKLQHAAAFCILALLAAAGNPRWSVLRQIVPLLLGYGLLIECVQWWLPWREFSLLDWVADAAGLVPAVLVLRLVRGARP